MSHAEKLLEKMRRSKSGYGQKEFEALYTGFGFEYEEGANHRVYIHPKYGLRATVARHNELAKGYASFAVKLIDDLIQMQAAEAAQGNTGNTEGNP